MLAEAGVGRKRISEEGGVVRVEPSRVEASGQRRPSYSDRSYVCHRSIIVIPYAIIFGRVVCPPIMCAVRPPIMCADRYGSTVANIEGKATAITVITPVKRGGPLLLWLVFWAGRNLQWTLRKLQTLSFIHFARWAVIARFPDGRRGERLNHTYLLFESNFNGAWEQYIDAFSEVVALRMKAIWGTSFGFPGPLPVESFKGYIRHNEFVANHYYSAYPGATTTEIVSAARVEAALEGLVRTAGGLDPDSFGEAYASCLTKMRRDL